MKIAIIGAGAAGCFAAANIPCQEGHEVVIFEKTGKALQKVRVSGGGRCNVTHHLFDIPEFAARYPRGKQLLKKSLYHFSPTDTIEWFRTRGVELKAEADGRMFPVTDNSETIIDCIWKEMMSRQVTVLFHKNIVAIEKEGEQFLLSFADSSQDYADRLLISCGAFPKAEQYGWLKSLGHVVESPVPSLFTFNIPKHPITELMGVSVPLVTVKVAGTKIVEQGPVLITHWGLSGPAILRASAWGARVLNGLGYNFTVLINWMHETTEGELKESITDLRRSQGKHFVIQRNPFGLPRRLWEFLTMQAEVTEQTRWGDLPAAAQNKLMELLLRHPLQISGKTTFKEEFVTCGGISISGIDPATMESKLVPGLYFAGEILDVDGITGGFNFQHAWGSGWLAARAIVNSIKIPL